MTGLRAAQQAKIELQAGESAEIPGAAVAKTTWPKTLSAKVAAIQILFPTTSPDPAELAAALGKRTKIRINQIAQILETLKALGKN